jgi:hypothetical protein
VSATQVALPMLLLLLLLLLLLQERRGFVLQ